MISDLLAFITVLAGLVLLGAVLSLPVLLVPERRELEAKPGVRIPAVAALTLVSLAISFGLVTRLTAMAAYTFTTLDPGALSFDLSPLQDYQDHETAIIQELWIQQAAPPFLEVGCTQGDETVCRLAGNIMAITESLWSAQTYGRNLRIGLVPTAVTGLLAWFLTRRKRGSEPRAET